MEENKLPVQDEEFRPGEIAKAVGLFLVAIVVPFILSAILSYIANPYTHQGSSPYFPLVVGLAALLNAAALIFSIRLTQKQFKTFKVAGVFLIILSAAYFLVLFLLWYTFAIFG